MKRCRASGSSLLLTESGTRRDGPLTAQRHVIRRDTGAMRADVAVRPGVSPEIGRQLSQRADLGQDVGGRVVCPGSTPTPMAILDDPVMGRAESSRMNAKPARLSAFPPPRQHADMPSR